MLGLSSNPIHSMPIEATKAIVPLGIGLASAAFLAMKAVATPMCTDDKVPMVPLRPGDSSHDNEYNEDPEAFAKRCEEEYGSMFNIHLFGSPYTVVSEPYIREVCTSGAFSHLEAFDEVTNVLAYFDTVRKSNKDNGLQTVHAIVRNCLNPRLPMFAPKIARVIEENFEQELSRCPVEKGEILAREPFHLIHEPIAKAMAHVFVGPEIAKSSQVIEVFMTATMEFGQLIDINTPHSKWHTLALRFHHKSLYNPLRKHLQVLIDASMPVILERRRLEALASEAGVEWERPNDILQHLLDDADKYEFVDLEDVCAHILILIIISVHTTADAANSMLYYMAAFPHSMDKLFEEQQQILNDIQVEREHARQECLKKGEPINDHLDPAHDRDLPVAAVKKMVHLDSFIREMFRFRIEPLSVTVNQRALKDYIFSNGVKIPKGAKVIINTRSGHTGPEVGEDATEFRPWRFVDKPKAAVKVGPDFLPFGLGRHACPGRFMAIMEIKIIGALIVTKFFKIEMQDPSKTKMALHARLGEPIPNGLKLFIR